MNITEKLMNIQVELKAPKNLYNSFGKYKYRNAEGIQEAVKPLLSKYKVSLTLNDEVICVADRVYVKATATIWDTEAPTAKMDAEGLTIDTLKQISVSAFAREASDKKGMDDAQVTGATSSYARKYALNGLFLLDDTKDVDTEEYQAQKNKASAPKTAPKSEPKPTDDNYQLPFDLM